MNEESQPSLALFEDTIKDLMKEKNNINVALLYFFVAKTSSFKIMNEKVPLRMKQYYKHRYEYELELLKIYETLNVEDFISHGISLNTYKEIADYLLININESTPYIVFNIITQLNFAINTTPKIVEKMLHSENPNQKLIQNLKEMMEVSKNIIGRIEILI